MSWKNVRTEFNTLVDQNFSYFEKSFKPRIRSH